MAKKRRRRKPSTLSGLTDSKYEDYFLWYAEELNRHGFIETMWWQEHSFVLSEAVSLKAHKNYDKLGKGFVIPEKDILEPHVYTPEAIIAWNRSAEQVFAYDIAEQNQDVSKFIPFISFRGIIKEIDGVERNYSLIEVKPDGYDFQNMTQKFVLNQKWMYQRLGYFTTLVYPGKLMKNTFTPQRYDWSDGMKQARKQKWTHKKIEEYVRTK